MGAPTATARESNGDVRVGDWVRELPADHHFQPCYCCLCRPQSGSRPVHEVTGIRRERESTFLCLEDEEMYPADEYERVPGPDGHHVARAMRLPSRDT